MVPGDGFRVAYERAREQLRRGESPLRDLGSPTAETVARAARLAKLVALLGDRSLALRKLGLTEPDVANLERDSGLARMDPFHAALYDHLVETLNLAGEARDASTTARDTAANALEPGAMLVENDDRTLVALGFRWDRASNKPRLAAVSFAPSTHGSALGRWDASLPDAVTTIPGRDALAVIGDLVLVHAGGELRAFDRDRGSERWTTPTGLSREGHLEVLTPLADASTIVVRTRDASQTLIGLDGRTGRGIWSQPLPSLADEVSLARGFGVVVRLVDGRPSIGTVEARTGRIVVRRGGEAEPRGEAVTAAFVDGSTTWLAVHGPATRRAAGGIVVIETASGRERAGYFEPPVRVLANLPPALAGDVSLWPGEGPNTVVMLALDRVATIQLPFDRFTLTELQADSALAVAAGVPTGTNELHLFGLDPATGHMLFHRKNLGAWMTNAKPTVALRRGVAYLASQEGDRVQLRAIDRDGGDWWCESTPSWKGHRFVGGYLAVDTGSHERILDPGSGQTLATWPVTA